MSETMSPSEARNCLATTTCDHLQMQIFYPDNVTKVHEPQPRLSEYTSLKIHAIVRRATADVDAFDHRHVI